MSVVQLVKEWRLKALTDLWTGDAAGKEQRTISIGLLGSIRWWFEVLVRGLGGTPCDPSDGGNRCPDQQGKRCAVCELFGSTGWARKFRFEVRDASGVVVKGQIKRNTAFTFRFTPLRPIAAEEWTLLDLTIRLIAEYGAIGGKTVLKPSDEVARGGLPHHHDYGIVKVEKRPSIQPRSRADLERYVRNGRWRKSPQQGFAWASLTNFWCVNGKYLARQSANQSTFNKVVGRDERKACRDCDGLHDPPNKCPKTKKHPRRYSERLATNDPLEQWLAGRQRESKKVFSFKEPPRTFGFVNPGVVTLDQMKQRLEQGWGSLGPSDFVTGDAILAHLMTHGGAAP